MTDNTMLNDYLDLMKSALADYWVFLHVDAEKAKAVRKFQRAAYGIVSMYVCDLNKADHAKALQLYQNVQFAKSMNIMIGQNGCDMDIVAEAYHYCLKIVKQTISE